MGVLHFFDASPRAGVARARTTVAMVFFSIFLALLVKTSIGRVAAFGVAARKGETNRMAKASFSNRAHRGYPNEIEEWRSDDVASWLADLGFRRYAASFLASDVDGESDIVTLLLDPRK